MARNHVVTIRVSDDELQQIDDVLGSMKSVHATGAGAEETNEAIKELTRADAFRVTLMGKRGEVSFVDLNLWPVLPEISAALAEAEKRGESKYSGDFRSVLMAALMRAHEIAQEQRAETLGVVGRDIRGAAE